MSKGSNRRPENSQAFSDNFDKIFGERDRAPTGVYVQTENGFVPRETYTRPDDVNAPKVLKPIEAFKSPIDGSIISDRGKLAKHNRKHGVTNVADYSQSFLEKRAAQRVNEGQKHLKDTRAQDIQRAIHIHTQ